MRNVYLGALKKVLGHVLTENRRDMKVKVKMLHVRNRIDTPLRETPCREMAVIYSYSVNIL